MTDLLEKTLYIGLGLFSMTKERAEEIINELVEKGKVSKDESAKAVRELMDRAEKEKHAFDKKLDAALENSIKRLHLATHDDVHSIEKKVDKLLKAQG